MRSRQKNVCQPCREHKIGCDGKRPSCSQCLHTRRVCAGYPPSFEFVAGDSHVHGCATRGRRRRRLSGIVGRRQHSDDAIHESQGRLVQHTNVTRALAPPLQDAVNLVLRTYVPNEQLSARVEVGDMFPRICGGWVMALPLLIDQCGGHELLPAAIKTLALSATSAISKSSSATGAIWQAYGATLELLQQSLVRPSDGVDYDQLAAIMCLALTDFLLGQKQGVCPTHMTGISALFEQLGPARFTRGIAHRLFIGFRPLLVLTSFTSRRTSFLMAEPWVTVPFESLEASPMQVLLNIALVIPSILERLDHLGSLSKNLRGAEYSASCMQLLEAAERLDMWQDAYANSMTEPPYWQDDISTALGTRTCLWFADISAANAYTYCWAFMAICHAEIQKVRQTMEASCPTQEMRDRYLQPLRLVSQSIPFLSLERHSLYGLSSVSFLSSTVLEISAWDASLHNSSVSAPQPY